MISEDSATAFQLLGSCVAFIFSVGMHSIYIAGDLRKEIK